MHIHLQLLSQWSQPYLACDQVTHQHGATAHQHCVSTASTGCVFLLILSFIVVLSCLSQQCGSMSDDTLQSQLVRLRELTKIWLQHSANSL